MLVGMEGQSYLQEKENPWMYQFLQRKTLLDKKKAR